MNPLRRLTIVGVGLIGGSIGLAARARNMAAEVVGFGSRPATLAEAHERGGITTIAPDLASAVADAELVVVCAPVDSIVEQVRRAAAVSQPGTLITDAGSTKAAIVEALGRAALTDTSWRPGVRFIGSHPLAGNEKKGPQHSTADLFVGRNVVLTPTNSTRGEDLRTLGEFWRALGAQVIEMAAVDHDRAMSATSHFPHLAAAAIALATPEEFVRLTASGWQDTTRIAAGDPALWRQIMLANRENLLASLDTFVDQLADWRAALESADAASLERLLGEAKRMRDPADS